MVPVSPPPIYCSATDEAASSQIASVSNSFKFKSPPPAYRELILRELTSAPLRTICSQQSMVSISENSSQSEFSRSASWSKGRWCRDGLGAWCGGNGGIIMELGGGGAISCRLTPSGLGGGAEVPVSPPPIYCSATDEAASSQIASVSNSFKFKSPPPAYRELILRELTSAPLRTICSQQSMVSISENSSQSEFSRSASWSKGRWCRDGFGVWCGGNGGIIMELGGAGAIS
eukprot:sb/3469415/